MLCDFWSGILLGTERYDGRPLAAHARLPVEPRHFERWLALFEAAAQERCRPEAAAVFIERARLIAASLLHGLEFFRARERFGWASSRASSLAAARSALAFCQAALGSENAIRAAIARCL